MLIRPRTLLGFLGMLALLAYVAYDANLFSNAGRREFAIIMARGSLELVILSIIVETLTNLSSTLKWHLLLRSQGISIPFRQLFASYMRGKFFNLILPTSTGGDAVRIHSLGRQIGSYTCAAASVFVDRLSGLVVLVCLTALAVLANLHLFGVGWLLLCTVFALLGVTVFCWLTINIRLHMLIPQLSQRLPLLKTPLALAAKAQDAVRLYGTDRRALYVAIAVSLGFYLLAMLNTWLSTLTFDSQVGLWPVLMVAPVIFFIRNLPISVGDLGLSEFAYIAVLSLIGVSPVVALSAALLLRVNNILSAVLGGLLYPMLLPAPVSQSHRVT